MPATGEGDGHEAEAASDGVVPFGPAPGATPPPQAPRGPRKGAAASRRIEVRPEDVLQPDRRPWERLSLEQVVVRAILFSALVVLGFLAIAAAVGKAVRAW
ncbi:MAG: hypothetical protein KGO51_04900 [Alphaproteobacteria bacterium]|nr:hypothetical protein [Alphaproteobacteria bacterium]